MSNTVLYGITMQVWITKNAPIFYHVEKGAWFGFFEFAVQYVQLAIIGAKAQ